MYKHFQYITGITAGIIATTAAVFSVTGVADIFAGAAMSVMIMASVLELGKIVAVSFLHRYWSQLSMIMKSYLLTAIVILMMITSIGIYGFLTTAYESVKQRNQQTEFQVVILQQRQQQFDQRIANINVVVLQQQQQQLQLQQQLQQLNSRQDTLINRGQTSIAKRYGTQTSETINAIKSSQQQINMLQQQQQSFMDSINNYNLQIQMIKSTANIGEMAAIRFLSGILSISPDHAVNLYILMFIFVFDPLAVVLVLATNISLVYDRNNKESTPILPVIEPETMANTIISEPVSDTAPESTNDAVLPPTNIANVLRGYVDGRLRRN